MRFRRVLFALMGLFFAAVLQANPASPQVVFVYADHEDALTITDLRGTNLPVTEGLALDPGATIRTKNTTAEFRLQPNGSALKLGKNTTFRIGNLEGLPGADANSFSVFVGKVRLIAAKVTGYTHAYTIQTPEAQAGVRGTDFAVEANAEEGDWVCVQEGAVEFSRTQGGQAEQTIVVSAGQFANVHAAAFLALPATPEVIADKFEDLDFHRLRESDVPGHSVSVPR